VRMAIGVRTTLGAPRHVRGRQRQDDGQRPLLGGGSRGRASARGSFPGREGHSRDGPEGSGPVLVRTRGGLLRQVGRSAGRRAIRGTASGISSDAAGRCLSSHPGSTIDNQIESPLDRLTHPGPLWAAVALAVVLMLLAFQRVGFSPRWVALVPLLMLLAAIAVVDVTTKMIPDALTLPGVVYALALAAFTTGGPTLFQAAG